MVKMKILVPTTAAWSSWFQPSADESGPLKPLQSQTSLPYFGVKLSCVCFMFDL